MESGPGLCIAPQRAARRGAAHSCPVLETTGTCLFSTGTPGRPASCWVFGFYPLMKFRARMSGLSPQGGLGHERDVALTPSRVLEQGSHPKRDSACPRDWGSPTPAEAAASPQAALGLAQFPDARPLGEARAWPGLGVQAEEQLVKAGPASAPCPGSTGCLSHICHLLPHRDPRPARLSTAALQNTHGEDLGSDSLALI